MFQVITIESGKVAPWRAFDDERDARRERDWLAYVGTRAMIWRNRA